jgi:hypothetical protein
LIKLELGADGLRLLLSEDETDQLWRVVFEDFQAVRVTSEESSGIRQELPTDGGFFEVQESPWILELGRINASLVSFARHFVICCYDETIEIIGSGPTFLRDTIR